MLQLLNNVRFFNGHGHEDPNVHLINFIGVCDNYKRDGVPNDAFKLCLFPFSFVGSAKAWL